MANGRPTPYQAFGTLYDRIKNVTDDHGRQPYVAPMRSRRDTTLSLKILNLLRAVGKPSAHEIDKAKRAALKTVHPDLLMGSPELISSNPAALEICLEEPRSDSTKRIPREGDLGTHANGRRRVGADQEPCGVPAAAEEATCGKRALPNGRGRPGAAADAPPTAAPQRAAPRATATCGAAPRHPGPPWAHSNHEATRQAAHDEATRVRREQDARRHRQERYQEEQPEPPPSSTAPSDSLIGWHAIDNLTVLECAVNPNAMLFDVPHACIAGYAHAQVDTCCRASRTPPARARRRSSPKP